MKKRPLRMRHRSLLSGMLALCLAVVALMVLASAAWAAGPSAHAPQAAPRAGDTATATSVRQATPTATPTPGPAPTPAPNGSGQLLAPDAPLFYIVVFIIFLIASGVLLLKPSWGKRKAKLQVAAPAAIPKVGRVSGQQMPDYARPRPAGAAAPSVAVPPDTPVRRTIICPRCGTQNNVGSSVCANCGLDLPQGLAGIGGARRGPGQPASGGPLPLNLPPRHPPAPKDEAKPRQEDASAKAPQPLPPVAAPKAEAAQPVRPKPVAPPPAVPDKGPPVPVKSPLSPVGTVFCPECGFQQEIGIGPCPRCGFDLHQALTMVQGMKPQEPAKPPVPASSARTPAPAPVDGPLPFVVAPDVGKRLPGQEEQPPQQGLLSGQVLGGKYRLEDLLGRGGVGVVYKASNQLLKRPQAVKVLLEHYVADAKFQERFLREAQTLAALDHANILPVHDFGLEESRAYLVMPFISGGTLEQLLKRRGSPLDVEQVRRALQHIAAALDYAHAQGVVHLDLKPANMLLHPDGRLLLSDFGLAHLLEAGAVEGGTSLQFGTPSYMAPEHIEGQPEPASDIYALGIILYQLLTGQLPFQGSSPLAIIRKQATEPPPPLRRFRPELPVGLEGVLGKALAKQPAARYQTAGALLAAFQQVISAR